MVTSDIDNYGTISINHMRYNAQITNGKMRNKINSKYMTLNVGEIGVSNTSTKYIRKYKRTLSGTYIPQEHNKYQGWVS